MTGIDQDAAFQQGVNGKSDPIRSRIGGLMRGRRVSVLLANVLLLAACVGPSRTDADFRRKTAESAQVMISLVETARVTTDLATAAKATPPYVSVVLSEAETDAAAVITAYSAVQPPSRSADRLREQALAALDAAHGHLEKLRIAAFRAELGDLSRIAAPLSEIQARLERFEQVAPT